MLFLVTFGKGPEFLTKTPTQFCHRKCCAKAWTTDVFDVPSLTDERDFTVLGTSQSRRAHARLRTPVVVRNVVRTVTTDDVDDGVVPFERIVPIHFDALSDAIHRRYLRRRGRLAHAGHFFEEIQIGVGCHDGRSQVGEKFRRASYAARNEDVEAVRFEGVQTSEEPRGFLGDRAHRLSMKR